MFKLINTVQNYAWGSPTALSELYGIANPSQEPMAELWMGAHPKSSSAFEDSAGKRHSLREWIAEDMSGILGPAVAQRFGELPFLFKVLCADQPLSIQVHPSKHAAEQGFQAENDRKIAINASDRNYKDANHKPELVYALTPFSAMNAFREFADIVALLQPVGDAHPAIADFLAKPDAQSLATLFSALLAMEGDEKDRALAILNAQVDSQTGEPWQTIARIRAFYPNDAGLFSPLLLNVVELKPGEAMFLFAETPHAYLNGVALEVMANSDNVLRAGLTPKYIDIPELMANLRFEPRAADSLLMKVQTQGNSQVYPIPVPDFALSLHTLSAEPQALTQESAAIVFCIEGHAVLTQTEGSLTLRPGESAFIPANDTPVTVSGTGRVARVYNSL